MSNKNETKEEEFVERWRYRMTTGKNPIDGKTKEIKPIIKIYVETPIKLEQGNLFAVDGIHEKEGKYLVELIQTKAEDEVDIDYLNEWASENYEPEPNDSYMDRD